MIHVYVSCGVHTATVAQCLSELYDSSSIVVLSKPEQLSKEKTINVFFLLGKEIAEFDRDPRAFKRNYGVLGATVVALGVNDHETILAALLRDTLYGVDSIGNISTILTIAPDFEKIHFSERKIFYSYLPGSNEGEFFAWSITRKQSRHACFVCNKQADKDTFFQEMSFQTNSVEAVNTIVEMFGDSSKNIKQFYSNDDRYGIAFTACWLHQNNLQHLRQKTEVKKLISNTIVDEVLSM